MSKENKGKKVKQQGRKFTRQEPYVLHGDRIKWVYADVAEHETMMNGPGPNRIGIDYILDSNGDMLVPA